MNTDSQRSTNSDWMWWEKPSNKTVVDFPISVIPGDKNYVATFNDQTKELLKHDVHGVAQGKTREDAINNLFFIHGHTIEYYKECMLNYERFVPIMVGKWLTIGGTWISIFGITIYFRIGKNMKGGMYIPFTPLNISIRNKWITYRNYMLNKRENKNFKFSKLSAEKIGDEK